MANSKMTKKDYFNALKKVVAGTDFVKENDGNELIAFIDHEIELLAKKHSKSGETARQKENTGVKATIINTLAIIGKPVTVTELQKECDELDALSNQRVSALLKQLIESGEVVKTIDKKRSLFSLAETDEEVGE